MTKFGLLGAAAVILSSTLASPVMAQQVINARNCAQVSSNGDCLNWRGTPYDGSYQRRTTTYRNDAGWNDAGWNDNRWERRDSGISPGEVAAGVVGGAIGTAGAIATAPFRDDSYAYYNGDSDAYYNNGYSGTYDDSYARRNGFVCQPGTLFTGEDGRRHRCQ
jgi:hypothetical protein